jgi:preprotein translocase subunit SecE
MAVAEASRVEKREKEGASAPGGGSSSGPPEWLTWVPRKLAELKLFFVEVRGELKKVTWPGRNEVQATTVVVIVTTIFFGFYLYGIDLVFSWLLSFILR